MSNAHGSIPEADLVRYADVIAAGRRMPIDAYGWEAAQPIGRLEQLREDRPDHGYAYVDHPLGHRMDDASSWRTCWYCGGMHPDDLLTALNAQGWAPPIDWNAEEVTTSISNGGIRISETDWKYGWPHKVYVDGLANPMAGQRVCFLGYSGPGLDESEHMTALAGNDRRAKFYTVHLADATDLDALAAKLSEAIPNIQWDRDATGRVRWTGRPGTGVRP